MDCAIRSAVAALCLSLLSACATSQAPAAPADASYGADGNLPALFNTAAGEVSWGWVRSIEPAGAAQDQAHGVGAMLGGVIGAIIGRELADGSSGKNLGTAIGAAAGALIGHEIEKGARRDRGGVRITVTLDNGGVRTFDLRDSGGLRVGERVRIEGNQVFRSS